MTKWIELPGLGVHVNNVGEIRNATTGHAYKLREPDPYVRVAIHRKGKNHHRFMHRLVAEAFLGDAPSPKHMVNHKNGIKHDNRVENLEWVTAAENGAHAARTGLSARGGKITVSKLTEQKVRELRQERSRNGTSYQKLGSMFGINAVTAWHVVKRRTWRHV